MAKENAKQPYGGITWESGAIITRNKLQNIDDAASNFSNEVAEARTRSNESSNSGSLKERLDNMIIGSTDNSDITDETMLWVDTNVENYTIPVQDDFDNLVLMQNAQPDTSTYPQKANKIWIKSSETQVKIPTSDELEQLQDTIASEYSTSKTYSVGDYVYYNGQLYKCINDVTTAGVWNANYWSEAVLADDITNLNNELQQINSNLSIELNWERGSIEAATGIDLASTNAIRTPVDKKIAVEALKEYIIITNSNTNVSCYYYNNDNYVDYSYHASGVGSKFGVIYLTIPQNINAVRFRASLDGIPTINASEGKNIFFYSANNSLMQAIKNLNWGSIRNSKMLSVGNSILSGALYPEGTLTHLCAYEDAPYGCVATALHINKDNVDHYLLSNTGLLYTPQTTNFLSKIKSIPLISYGWILTHLWTADMDNYPLGDLTSTAGDGTIAGAVISLINYIYSNNSECKLILIGIPPVSTTIKDENVFLGRYANGKNLIALDKLMHQMAKKYNFIYIDWEQFQLSFSYQNYTYNNNNVHARFPSTYRAMGEYLSRKLLYNDNSTIDIEKDINVLKNYNQLISLSWESGSLILADGTETNSYEAHRTDYIPFTDSFYFNIGVENYNVNIFFYDSNKNFISVINRMPNKIAVRKFSEAAYFRISVNIPQTSEALLQQINCIIIKDLSDYKMTIASSFSKPIWYSGYITNNSTTVSLTEYSMSSNYVHTIIPVHSNEQYCITGAGASAARLYCWCDSEMNIISATASNTTVTNRIVMAPSDAKYLIVNVKITEPYDVIIYNNKDLCLKPFNFNYSDFEQGRYDPNTGESRASNTFIRSKSWLSSELKYLTVIDTTLRVAVLRWNKTTGAFVSGKFWLTTEGNIPYVFDHNTYAYKLYFGHIIQQGEGDLVGDVDGLLGYSEKGRNQEQYLINENTYYKQAFASMSQQITQMQKMMPYNIHFANASAPLNFKNYLGNTQNVHPKVLYFENGFNNYKYWMGYTPYPYADDKYENPCIAYSNDRERWYNIPINPLDTPPENGYYSDTHLVYNSTSQKLECWYRFATADNIEPREERIYRRTSNNGFNWSEKELLYTSTGATNKILSPAIIYSNNLYYIWCVNNSTDKIDYYIADSNGTNWTYNKSFTFNFSDPTSPRELRPWHMDLLYHNETYIMLLQVRNAMVLDQKMELFISTSQDNNTYTTPELILEGSEGWDKYLYRSSIINNGNEYIIYYSAGTGGELSIYSVNCIWGIGMTKSTTLDNFYGYLPYEK